MSKWLQFTPSIAWLHSMLVKGISNSKVKHVPTFKASTMLRFSTVSLTVPIPTARRLNSVYVCVSVSTCPTPKICLLKSNPQGDVLGHGAFERWLGHEGETHMNGKKVKVLVPQLCLTLCEPMDCSLPGSSVHGILQARILELVAIPFSRDLLDPGRDWTQVSCIAGRFFITEPPGKSL